MLPNQDGASNLEKVYQWVSIEKAREKRKNCRGAAERNFRVFSSFQSVSIDKRTAKGYYEWRQINFTPETESRSKTGCQVLKLKSWETSYITSVTSVFSFLFQIITILNEVNLLAKIARITNFLSSKNSVSEREVLS